MEPLLRAFIGQSLNEARIVFDKAAPGEYDILVDGKRVGSIERINTGSKRHASSGRLIPVYGAHAIELWDDDFNTVAEEKVQGNIGVAKKRAKEMLANS